MAIKDWDLQEIIAATRAELGEAPSTYITDVEITRWINLALIDFYSRTRLGRTSATASTVNGQKKYGLPNDFGTIEKVFVDGDELEPLDDHELLMDVTRDNLDTPGTPESYYIRGTADSAQCLFLHPVPQGVLPIEMWYVSVPDEVSALDKTISASIIPAEFIMALVYFAAERGRRKMRMIQDAREARTFYEEIVARAQASRGQWNLDRPQTIKDELVWNNKATRRTW